MFCDGESDGLAQSGLNVTERLALALTPTAAPKARLSRGALVRGSSVAVRAE
jgi:hypothetical protein